MKYLLFFFSTILYASPQYYCTASNDRYYVFLLNLIGSVHKNNFDNLGMIFVYDLGMESFQIQQLNQIQKVQVCRLKGSRPEILRYYLREDNQRGVLGWYAWKPVVIEETLEQVPYVLWLDAGTLVLKDLSYLFLYLEKNPYFLCANEMENDFTSIRYRVTEFVRREFALYDPKNQWLLEKNLINGGVIGVNRIGRKYFLDEWFSYTKDLQYFEDDGSSLCGLGGARHDLTLLSLIAHRNQLQIFIQDTKQQTPIKLSSIGEKHTLFITWNKDMLNDQTSIYNSRGDFRTLTDHLSWIHWK